LKSRRQKGSNRKRERGAKLVPKRRVNKTGGLFRKKSTDRYKPPRGGQGQVKGESTNFETMTQKNALGRGHR